MEKSFSIGNILFNYFSTLPEGERAKFAVKGISDPKSLAKAWEDALTTDRAEGIIESFRYYEVLRDVSAKEECRLSYNDTKASTYPFVVESIFNLFRRRCGSWWLSSQRTSARGSMAWPACVARCCARTPSAGTCSSLATAVAKRSRS